MEKISHIVRKASLKDLLRISKFFKANFSGEGRYGTVDLFSWKTIDNPTSTGFVNFIEIGDEVAATTSITPKTLKFQGTLVKAAEIGDTYTSPKFFRRGLFTIVGNTSRQQAEDNGIRYVYGLPNATALPGWLKKANFKTQPSLQVRALSLPTSANNKLSTYLGWSGMELLGGLARITLATLHKIRSLRHKKGETYKIEQVESLPTDWNAFWDQASQKYDFIISRTCTEMSWRYLSHPDKYIFLTVRLRSTLIGYLVYKNVPTDFGYSMIVADFLFLPDSEEGLHIAINTLVDTSFKTMTRAISLWCEKSSPYYAIFLKHGFKDKHEIPVIVYNNELKEKLRTIGNPHFTMGDSDNV